MAEFVDLREALDKLDMASYLDMQSVEYRETHGSRGLQLNVKECPSCGGNKWKVFMNAETGLGNCFSGDCQQKYNKYSFIKAFTDLPDGKVVAHIMQASRDMGWRPKRRTAVAVNTEVKDLKLPHCYKLPIQGKNLSYLENRGITLPVAEYMHLYFCNKGLFPYVGQDGVTRYQDFSKRIIIPVFDLDGNMVSFQGRDITGLAEKKYLFPNGYASTGTMIYNGHNVHNTKRILVGEGVFDVAAQKIAMDSEPDLRDVIPVGTFGKHLSFGHEQSQLSKFKVLFDRGVREVTIMWDGEISATDDAIEAGRQLKTIGFDVRIAMLPDGKDPNEISSIEVCSAFYRATPLNAASAVKLKLQRRNGG